MTHSATAHPTATATPRSKTTAPTSARDTRPNFFIVGAPKCGTTAMNDFLAQHPDIFIPKIKEVHFFGRDLHFSKGALRDPEAYAALFADATQPRRGEASVWYLFSKTAAAEIHAYNPEAKIIIMLRHPADMLYSQHSQFLFNGNEDIEDFQEALAAESDRRAGRRIPKSAHLPEGLLYSETVRYAEQVERYLTRFGREGVHIILYDDFRADLPGTYRKTLQFLGVRDDFVPTFNVINPNKRARSKLLREFVQAPPESVKRLSRLLFPRPFRQQVMNALDRLNVRYEARAPLDPELRAQLARRFEPEVRALETLLGRPLPWYPPAQDAAGPVGPR
jgi:hypothetical protein